MRNESETIPGGQGVKISILRLSVLPVLAAQWFAVIAEIIVVKANGQIFADFDVQLPVSTIIAFHLTNPTLLIFLSVVVTLILIVVEAMITSQPVRLVIQIANLCFWLVLISFCLTAIELPFIEFRNNL